MLTNEAILCLSSIDWDSTWQVHQEIMSSLADWGNHVLFVENTGIRPPRLRDLRRLRQRFQNWRRGCGALRLARPNLDVCSPLLLPLPYSFLAQRLNRVLLVRTIKRWLQTTRGARPVAWTFLPTPLTRLVVRAIDPEIVVYHCVENMPGSSRAARPVEGSEARLFAEADVVFTTTESLRARALRFRDVAYFFPPGVRLAAFEAARTGSIELPRDVRALSRPIVGYVGAVSHKLDQALLIKVATQLPSLSFVMVGPVECDVSRLRNCPNVHLLGPRAHGEIPIYLRAFDVGIIPYCVTDYTAHVYPVKLNEYLAMGLPVVATELEVLRQLNAQDSGLVRLAREPEAFTRAIRDALLDTGPGAAAHRVAVAQQHQWDSRVRQMTSLVAAALAHRRGAAGAR